MCATEGSENLEAGGIGMIGHGLASLGKQVRR